MKIVLSKDELMQALSEYIAKKNIPDYDKATNVLYKVITLDKDTISVEVEFK